MIEISVLDSNCFIYIKLFNGGNLPLVDCTDKLEMPQIWFEIHFFYKNEFVTPDAQSS